MLYSAQETNLSHRWKEKVDTIKANRNQKRMKRTKQKKKTVNSKFSLSYVLSSFSIRREIIARIHGYRWFESLSSALAMWELVYSHCNAWETKTVNDMTISTLKTCRMSRQFNSYVEKTPPATTYDERNWIHCNACPVKSINGQRRFSFSFSLHLR